MGDCKHREDPLSDGTGLNYVAWHADAERRRKQGRDKQWRCPVCKRWIWADLWDPGAMGSDAGEED